MTADHSGTPRDIAQVQLAQAAYIRENFPDLAIYPVPAAGGPQAGDFFYRRGHLMTRRDDAGRVLAALGPAGPLGAGEVTRLAGGLAHIRFGPHPSGDLAAEHEALYASLAAAHDQLGPGVVSPDHLVFVTPAGFCPATEPDFVPADAAPSPPVSPSTCCTGAGVRVAVVDTGLIPDAPARHPWLAGVTGDEDLEVSEGASLVRYGGHGTFIASIIRAMAPQAEVRVHRLFERAGAIYESELVRALDEVMAWSPDVISLSAGTHTWRHHGLLSFSSFVAGPLRARGDQAVLVAAAGNDGQDWKFSPAELDGVIGVGALNRELTGRAWFSDYGDWVSVYAPGEDLVHAFARGAYTYMERPEPGKAQFEGMARWSGTSFATPVVAGLIAARVSGTGKSPRAAASDLLELAAAQALAGLGPVLLPGDGCPHQR
jgi:hypothetical protein